MSWLTASHRRIVVVGATGALGAALVEMLLSRDCYVVGTCREPASSVARGKSFELLSLDLTVESSIVEFAHLVSHHRIDAVVFCSGSAFLDRADQSRTEEVEAMLWQHVIGPHMLITRLLQGMSADGRVINVSSSLASHARPSGYPYGLAKHAAEYTMAAFDAGGAKAAQRFLTYRVGAFISPLFFKSFPRRSIDGVPSAADVAARLLSRTLLPDAVEAQIVHDVM